MFLIWVALLAVLFMLMAAPLPDRMRAFGLVGAAMTVWILWALYGVELLADAKWPQVLGSGIEAEGRTARLGQVGDLFGGVNALFAALAFAGVGIAAYQQWKTTRLGFKQSIESTFFSALELHHKIADGLSFERDRIFPSNYDIAAGIHHWVGKPQPERAPPARGRQVFVEVIKSISGSGNESSCEALIGKYRVLQNEHNYVLGHYFRNLYQILKLVDGDEALDTVGKQKYLSILRAQLSSDELALLLVNCVDKMVDDGEFRTLVVRYRMLEHIPLERQGSNYLYTGQSENVVLADEESIKQFLVEAEALKAHRVISGAFGTNPAFRE